MFSPSYIQIVIGGQIVTTVDNENLSRLFTQENPLPLVALQYHDVRINCIYSYDKLKTIMNDKKCDISISLQYDCIEYTPEVSNRIINTTHKIPLPRGNFLRIIAGMGGRVYSVDPDPE